MRVHVPKDRIGTPLPSTPLHREARLTRLPGRMLESAMLGCRHAQRKVWKTSQAANIPLAPSVPCERHLRRKQKANKSAQGANTARATATGTNTTLTRAKLARCSANITHRRKPTISCARSTGRVGLHKKPSHNAPGMLRMPRRMAPARGQRGRAGGTCTRRRESTSEQARLHLAVAPCPWRATDAAQDGPCPRPARPRRGHLHAAARRHERVCSLSPAPRPRYL